MRDSCAILIKILKSAICPFIYILHLIYDHISEATGPEEKFRFPSTQQHSPAPPRGSYGIPRPEKMYNPFSMFLVCLGIFSQWDVSGKRPEGGVQEATQLQHTRLENRSCAHWRSWLEEANRPTSSVKNQR